MAYHSPMADNPDRDPGLIVDLEGLEEQAKSLYLHRFVRAIQDARGEFGRYLTLRSGDRLAIDAAGDGSAEWLARIVVEEDVAPGA